MEAFHSFRRAVEANPSLVDAWDNIGSVATDLGATNVATKAWMQVRVTSLPCTPMSVLSLAAHLGDVRWLHFTPPARYEGRFIPISCTCLTETCVVLVLGLQQPGELTPLQSTV